MSVIAAIQRQKLQPARKACGSQHSSLRVIIRKTFLAVVDVTHNKEILEGQDLLSNFVETYLRTLCQLCLFMGE